MIKRLLTNRVFRNFSILTLSNILVQLLSVLSSIRLARLLQPEGYGLYNLVMVQAEIFAIVAAFGLRYVIVRHVARNKGDSRLTFRISNQIRLITTSIAVLCLLAYNFLRAENSLAPQFLYFLGLLVIFKTLWDSIESIAFGNERMEGSAFINLFFTSLWVTAVYIIPKANFSIEILLTVFVINEAFKSFAYYLWLNRKIFRSIAPSVDRKEINHMFFARQSTYFFILAVFTTLQNQVPILLLDINSTVDQIGIFNLGNRILGPMQMILAVLLTSIYPSLSRLAFEDKELFTTRMKNILNLLLIVGIWACFCFTLYSREVVLLLYGIEYIDSARVILIQCWFTMLYSIFSAIGTTLMSFDKQRVMAILSIIYGTLAFPVYFIGSKYAAIGLAWAFVIAAFLHMTYHWIVFKNLLSPYLTWGYTARLFLTLGIAMACSLFIPFEFSFILKIMVGLCITIIAGLYLKFVELKKITI